MSWAEDEGRDGYDPEEDYAYGTMTYGTTLTLDTTVFRLVWKTKDGQSIFIEDMATSHIKNILKANLESRMSIDAKSVATLINELSIRLDRPNAAI